MSSFNTLIIGGSAAELSCALILGSALDKPFATSKKIGIIIHQKNSALKNAELNNVMGFKKGTKGEAVLKFGLKQLSEDYSKIIQIEKEKVIKIDGGYPNFTVVTNKNSYQTKNVVVAVGPSNLFDIEGLNKFVQPHIGLPSQKERIMLKNTNHLVIKGIYVAGVLAGWRSQFAIAAGSGAQVATDILTEWNQGNPTMIHDAVK